MTLEVKLCTAVALCVLALIILLPAIFWTLDIVLDRALAEAGWTLPGEEV